MSDGTTRDLGEFVGRDGVPGKDGADFANVEIDYDGERTIIIRGQGGEIRKHLPIPLDRGYWRDGMDRYQIRRLAIGRDTTLKCFSHLVSIN